MWNTVLFILVVALAVFIQSVAGFGGNLLAMPLGIVLVGVGVAKPIMTIVACITGIMVTVTEWRNINKKELLKMLAVMFFGVLLGLWLFGSVSLDFLLIIYAVVLILIGCKKLFFENEKDLPVPLQWASLAIAGIMQGLFVSGGSFLMVYAVAKLKKKEAIRSTVNAVWAILNIFLIATYQADGTLTADIWKMAAICVVPTLLAVFGARAVVKKIDQKTFLKIAYVILIASGAVLLISNL